MFLSVDRMHRGNRNLSSTSNDRMVKELAWVPWVAFKASGIVNEHGFSLPPPLVGCKPEITNQVLWLQMPVHEGKQQHIVLDFQTELTNVIRLPRDFLMKIIFFNMKMKIVSKPVNVIMSGNRIFIDVQGWVMLQFASGSVSWRHLHAELIVCEFICYFRHVGLKQSHTIVCWSREEWGETEGCPAWGNDIGTEPQVREEQI